MNLTGAIVHTALIFLGALFAPLALGQLDPFPKDDAEKGAKAAPRRRWIPSRRGPASSRNWCA